VAAARCPIALDTAMLDLLMLNQTKSPLWSLAAARGLDGSDRNNLCYPLLSPQDFYGSGFKAPHALNGIRFNPYRFLRGLMRRMIMKIST
jgi:hypothetical protein